ncbi:33 kDa chaperonin [Clostridia bacterium]|nr:33 kDa chaperonin [Clostridia bacterium]
MQQDKLIKIITRGGRVKLTVARTTDIVNRAVAIHDTYPVSTAALGRTLTAASIMGTMLKDIGASVTLRIKGDGAVSTVMAVAGQNGDVRGLISNNHVILPPNAKGKLDVSGAIGNGIIAVSKDIPSERKTGAYQPFIGQTELISGEIAEDVANYFVRSEQIPSVVGLGVLVGEDNAVISSGGFILQLIPQSQYDGERYGDEELISKLEANAAKMPQVSGILNGGTLEDVANAILSDIEYDILEDLHPQYRCTCSRERTKKALISIGRADLTELLADNIKAKRETTQMKCQFCGKSYRFKNDEISAVLND